MTATAHALVAGAVASRFANPATAVTLALISHYIMDSIPHWDIGTNWRTRAKNITGGLAVIETLFGISLSYMLFRSSVPLFLWAITVGASLLPDWLETPWYILFSHHDKHTPVAHASVFEKLSFKMYKIQNIFHAKTQLPLGLITQVVTVGFFLFLLK